MIRNQHPSPRSVPPSPGRRPNAKSSSQIEPISLAKTMLRKWGLLAGMLGLVFTGGAVALTIWLFEPQYEARQYVVVNQNPEYTEIDPQGQGKVDPVSYLTQIKHPQVLTKLLMDDELLKMKPGLDRKKLEKMVRYEKFGGDSYAIVCRDTSPKFAQQVAEKLAVALVEYHSNNRQVNLNALSRELGELIKDKMQEIDGINTRLEHLNEQTMKSVEGGDESVIDPNGGMYERKLLELNEIKKQLKANQEEMAVVQGELAGLEEKTDETAINDAVMASPQILNIDRQITDLQLEQDKDGRGPQHPDMKARASLIDSLAADRAKAIVRLTALKTREWVESQRRGLQAQIDQREQHGRQLDRMLASAQREVEMLLSNFQEVNRINFEMDQKKEELARAYEQKNAWVDSQNRILSREKSLKDISISQVNGENAKVELPQEPVEILPWKLMAIAGLAGLGLPFALAFLLEYRFQRVSTPDQIQHQVELIGEIADLPARATRPGPLSSKRFTKQLKLYEESVDSLSAMLLLSAEQHPLVYSVTSAASNEGKTTLASQLAICSARSGRKRTLLIDTDLRSPSIHRVFDVPLDGGLGDVLSGKLTLQQAVKESGIEGLDVVTAGRTRGNPRSYFSCDAWSRFLEEARELYEQVIVDTPPVLAASESITVSRECDQTVFCVLRDVSRADSVKRAHERLVSSGVNVIGCAFSGVPQAAYSQRYGSYEYNL